jgi:CheY-like chemotaxis protein
MSNIHILVADDFAPWRIYTRNIVQRPEWQVIEACDGQEAVQKAIEHRPDVVLLDIGMPILNGIEAAKQIRKSVPSSRIIFVTTNGDGDLKAAALATGADGYLSKASVTTELLPALAVALRPVTTEGATSL